MQSSARSRIGAAMLVVMTAACGSIANTKPPDKMDAAIDAPADAAEPPPDAPPPDAPSGSLPPAPTGVTFARGTVTGALGDLVGDLSSDACAAGTALTGFTGFTGIFSAGPPEIDIVGQVAGHCSAIGIGDPTQGVYPLRTGTETVLTARGSGNKAAFSLLCPADQFVVGLSLRIGSALDQLKIQCAPVTLTASGTAWVGTVGAATLLDKIAGGGGGVGPIAASCPAGQIATIAHSRVIASSSLFSGMMLGCRAVTGK